MDAEQTLHLRENQLALCQDELKRTRVQSARWEALALARQEKIKSMADHAETLNQTVVKLSNMLPPDTMVKVMTQLIDQELQSVQTTD